MITKVTKVKGFGIFNDFRWNKDTPLFHRYNLLYGWNGTGKTTLSRLLSLIESGDTTHYPNCEYEFESDRGTFKNGQSFPYKIRVFNSDYVNKNVRILNGDANPIVIVGEGSQETMAEIKKYQTLLNGDLNDTSKVGLLQNLTYEEEKKRKAEEKRDGLFTSIARTIGVAFGGEAIRSYTKKSSQPDFRELTQKEELDETDYERFSAAITQKEELSIENLSIPPTEIEESQFDTLGLLNEQLIQVTRLMAQTVDVVTIERLKLNPDISKWVEEGLVLHKNHLSENCEFCGQILPESRLAELGNYFNDADRKLKEEIDGVLEKLRLIYKIIGDIYLPDKARFYKDIQEEFEKTVTEFKGIKQTFLDEIKALGDQLKEKKLKTWEALTIETATSSQNFLAVLEKANTFINRHNQDSKDLESKRKEAQNKIKKHHLSNIYDEVKSLDQLIADSEKRIDILLNGDPNDSSILGINQLNALIDTAQKKVSSAHNGCGQLNDMLKDLLGRIEIVFEVQEDPEEKISGYLIKRNGNVAKDISDGEQMAIAFAYFCVHLKDKDFNIKEGIVVIDDPVSSLDSGMLFRVCAHIESHLVKAHQLFVLTHNYELLNQIKQWFKNSPQINNVEKEEDKKGQLLMLQSIFDETNKCRAVSITELDELLRDYETEYHYIFKKLLQFDEDNPPQEGLTLKGIYDYPNMTRKLLECFLSFRCPKSASFYVRLMGLKEINDSITGEDLEYVYSFVNSHSHLNTKHGLIQFDPTLAVSGRESIKKALTLIEFADEKHYKAMVKAIKITSL